MQEPVKCLIVDDIEENILVLSSVLHRDDVQLLTARSGLEALELLLANEVALALLDVQMPDMDGFQLAELMRGSERTRHIPIIFVTAGARNDYRLFKGYETGAVDFLYKPIDPYILNNKADVFFQLYRQKQQLAQELRERTETLRLNEMFTAVLGHDLRNPLNAVLLSATLMQRRSQSAEVQKAASTILSSGKRMQRMIEDMLDLARARLAEGIPISRGGADLGLLVRRVVMELQTAYPERSIEIHSQGDLNGDWDGDRLAQAASNLIGNALQHGDAAQPVRIELDGAAAEHASIAVCNGGGIRAEIRQRLFDPFARVQLKRNGGLGLGLYIVQQIVHAHRGRIEVTSEDGQQTCFLIQLPRQSD